MLYLNAEKKDESILTTKGILLWFTLGCVIAFSLAAPAAGQNCLDYSQSALWVGSVNLNDTHYHSEFVDGDHMYIIDGGKTEVFDISDMINPVSVGTFNGGGRNGCKIDDFIYFCDWHSNFRVWNVADLNSPYEVTVFNADLYDMTPYGSLIVGCGTNDNLIIIDVSEPSEPVVLADFSVDIGTLKDVIVHDGIVWIAGYSRVAAVDISNPELPEIISLAHNNGNDELAAWGNVLMVIQRWSSRSQALFLNIENPSNPTFLSREPFDFPDYPKSSASGQKGIIFTNDTVYIGGRVIDVSDIENPKTTNYLNSSGYTLGNYLNDGYIILAKNRQIDVFDVHQNTKLEVDGRLPGLSVSAAFSPSGDIVCSPGGIYRTVFHDVSDLGRPLEIDNIVTGGWCSAAALSNDLAFLASNDHGFIVMQYSHEGITQIGEIDDGYIDCRGIEVENETVYLAHEYGISAFDISIPAEPQLLGTFYPENNNYFHGYKDLEVHDGVVFATGYHRFDIMDFTSPETPTLLGTSDLGNYRFCLDGDYALLTWGFSIRILDIADYSNPFEVSSLDFQNHTSDITVVDGIAYIVGSSTIDLQVVDINDPLNPATIGWLNTGGSHQGITASNGRLFISDGSDGLAYVRPHCSGTTGIKFDDFTATGGRGNAEITWRSPSGHTAADFILIGQSATREWEIPISNAGSQLLAQDQSWNLAHGGEITYALYLQNNDEPDLYLTSRVTEVDMPDYKILLAAPYPNPFNPMTTIDFALDEPREIKVAIYDLHGRQVKILAQGLFESGLNSLNWDGTDGRGDVAAGMYFVRISSGHYFETKKLTLVR